jgi:TP901 family phage tail tape measure protein
MTGPVLARPTIEIVGDDSGLTAALVRAEKNLQRTGERMQRLGAALTGAITLPILAIGTVAAQAAIKFESSFAGIRKTMDLTERQFGELAAANRTLAKEIPVSVNELNRIGELAGQLGIRGVANVIKFEDTIAKLAVTTDLTADTAALSFAQIANVMQLPQNQIDRLGASVVDLGNNFATVESMIVDFTQRIAGAGKIAGLSAGDVTGIGAAFASLGIEAQAGGTAVQKVLLSMLGAVTQGGAELGAFARTAGLSATQFAEAFRDDAAGAFASFVEGLGRQGDAAIGTLEALGLQDQRLIRAFLGAAGAGDLLRQAIDRGNIAFEENTALTEEAAKRFQTAASQLTTFKNRLNDIAITLGQALVPILLKALDAMSPVLRVIEAMAGAFAAAPPPIQLAVVALVGLAAAAGPALFAIGAMVKIAPVFAAGLFKVRLAIVAVQASLGPIGLAIAAASAALAVATWVWRRWGEDIRLVARATLNVVQTYLAPIGTFVAAVFAQVLTAARWLRDNAIKPIITFVTAVAEWMGERLSSVVGKAAEALIRVFSILNPGFALVLRGVRVIVADIIEEVARLRAAAGDIAPIVDDIKGLTLTSPTTEPGPLAAVGGLSSDIQEIVTDFERLLDANVRMSTLLGGSFDKVAADAEAYRSVVEALAAENVSFTATLSPQIGTLGDLAARFLQLQGTLDANASAADAFNKRWGEIVAQAQASVQAGKALTASLLTPAEEYEAAQTRIGELLAVNAIKQETANRALAAARRAYDEATTGAQVFERAASSAALSAGDAFADFALGAGDSIRDFVNRAMRDLARLLARLLIIKLLKDAFAGSTGGFGLGVLAFLEGASGRASGGPVLRNRAYVVGERGPELFVPQQAGQIVSNGALQNGGGTDPAEYASAMLAAAGPPPRVMSPEAAAMDDWWRRFLSAGMRDGANRGVRLAGA